MLVRNWMTEQVEVVHPDDPVAAVETRLRARGFRQFPVVRDGRLVGIVTDRDIRACRDPQARVADIMAAEPVTTAPGTPVEDAAAVLRDRKIGALPVMEGGELVGIISESDLLAAVVELCRVLEPTTLIELDCEEGGEALRRVRSLLETRGGDIRWMSSAPDGRGHQRIALRVRMPVGRAPERILEEAGLPPLSCITGRAAEGR